MSTERFATLSYEARETAISRASRSKLHAASMDILAVQHVQIGGLGRHPFARGCICAHGQTTCVSVKETHDSGSGDISGVVLTGLQHFRAPQTFRILRFFAQEYVRIPFLIQLSPYQIFLARFLKGGGKPPLDWCGMMNPLNVEGHSHTTECQRASPTILLCNIAYLRHIRRCTPKVLRMPRKWRF